MHKSSSLSVCVDGFVFGGAEFKPFTSCNWQVRLRQAGNFLNKFSAGLIFSLHPLLYCPNKHGSAEYHDSKIFNNYSSSPNGL